MPSIMGIVVKEALDATGSHPRLDKKRCLNARQGRLRCDACLKVCPSGALEMPEKGRADWEKCQSCGLCAAACPAGALGFTDYRQRKAAQLLADERPVHILGCQQAQGDMDSKAWCLSAFPWELIAGLALRGRVELVCGDCESCPRRGKKAGLDTALARVRRFLGEERYAQRVTMRDAHEATKREVSRRELFSSLLPTARRRAKPQEIAVEDFGDAGQAMRLMLAAALRRHGDQEEKFGWEAPHFTQKCWACGICAKICPNEALSVREKDGVWRVVCTPALCTGCGACGAVCMDGGVDGMRTVQLAAGKKRVAHKTQALVCPECGGAVRPDSGYTLCLRCRVRPKRNKK